MGEKHKQALWGPYTFWDLLLYHSDSCELVIVLQSSIGGVLFPISLGITVFLYNNRFHRFSVKIFISLFWVETFYHYQIEFSFCFYYDTVPILLYLIIEFDILKCCFHLLRNRILLGYSCTPEAFCYYGLIRSALKLFKNEPVTKYLDLRTVSSWERRTK